MLEAKLVFKKNLPRGQFCVYQSRPDFDLICVKQTHSSIVLNESSCNDLEADGMIGNSQIPMAILTADCVPVLLLGEKNHALIHSGWRGLCGNILNNELIKNINPIYAFIGPHIKVENYEVQKEFVSHFDIKSAFNYLNDKIYFNLSVVTKFQLEKNFPGITIEESDIDTFSNEIFFSYRRNKTTLRNWNVYIP